MTELKLKDVIIEFIKLKYMELRWYVVGIFLMSLIIYLVYLASETKIGTIILKYVGIILLIILGLMYVIAGYVVIHCFIRDNWQQAKKNVRKRI